MRYLTIALLLGAIAMLMFGFGQDLQDASYAGARAIESYGASHTK